MHDAPGELPTTTSRLIAIAVSLVGDTDRVLNVMRCSSADFEDYCAGRKEPTALELGRLISLIIHEQGKSISQNRELLKRARERRPDGST